tara:strand:+ start:108 stop:302 length:195 start_codon:yes stop_codon:yes gene_type:complete
MPKISDIDLGSTILSTFILIGFIATAFVFIRLAIIGINYIKVNFSIKQVFEKEDQKNITEKKGF